VLVGLAVVGLLAAATVTYSFVREATLASRERQVAAKVDAVVAGSAKVAAALRAFGAARESESAWFSRTSALVDELESHVRAADAALAGIAMMPGARVAEALQAAGEAVERAHANASADKALMAQDVIDSNGKPAADALDAALPALRAAAADEMAAVRYQWHLLALAALGVWALVWGIGLAWFALAKDEPRPELERDRQPRAATTEPVPEAATALAATPEPPAVPDPVAAPEPAAPVPAPAAHRSIPDVGTVASACEAVAGLTDAAQMASALENMAQALGASGLVLWMRDGDALAAAAAHGYPPGIPQRLGRVAAEDANLIARAWQARSSQTAPERPGQRAAVAAPIGAAGVVTGVLAAEFPEGREADEDVVATSRILAAQLSAVLGEGGARGTTHRFEATGS
jgi:hypothetical protein